jgi:hypothetical protein
MTFISSSARPPDAITRSSAAARPSCFIARSHHRAGWARREAARSDGQTPSEYPIRGRSAQAINRKAAPPAAFYSCVVNSRLFQEAGGIDRCTISGSCYGRSRGLTSRRPAGRSRAWHRRGTGLMSGRHGRSIGAAVIAAGSLGKHAGRRCAARPLRQTTEFWSSIVSPCLLIGTCLPMGLNSYPDSVQSRPTSKLTNSAIFSTHRQRRSDQSARHPVDNLGQTTERTNAVAVWQPRHGVRTPSMVPCLQWGI